jgi:uncharacterized membrane protein
MIEGKSLERLISFTDAIVAVAITLLILPLTDFFADVSNSTIAADVNSEKFTHLILGFIISFFIIFSFWNGHRNLFAHVTSLSKASYWLNIVWILTIVAIPATTNIIVNLNGLVGTLTYGIVLLIGSLSALLLRWQLTHHLTLVNWSTVISLIVCNILCIIFPSLGANVFFLLLLAPLVRLITTRRAAHHHVKAS